MKVPKGLRKISGEISKTVAVFQDSLRFKTRVGSHNHFADNLNNLRDTRIVLLKDKLSNSLKNADWYNSLSTSKRLQKGTSAIPPDINRIITRKLPHNHYSEWMRQTDTVAKKLGFFNEIQFSKWIERLNVSKSITVENSKKLGDIYQYITNFIKKHPSSLAKAALAGGSIAFMVTFMQNFQKENTGCFRYSKDDQNCLVRYKFDGDFCLSTAKNNSYNIKNNNSNNNNSDETVDSTKYDDIKLLPMEQHPLFGVTKWECDYRHDADSKEVDEILHAGCQGLCDWLNFNILAQNTQEYSPIDLNTESGEEGEVEDEEDDDREALLFKYIYRCEKSTFLRALTVAVFDIVDETITGFSQSQLGQKTFNFIRSQARRAMLWLIVFVLILVAVRFFTKRLQPQQQLGRHQYFSIEK